VNEATCPRCGRCSSELEGAVMLTCTRECGWERGMRAKSTDVAKQAVPARVRSKQSRARKKAGRSDFSVASALVRAVALSV